MRVLSSILRKLVYPALGKVGYFRSGAAVSIVTYHGVLPNGYRTPDVFLDSALLSLKSFRSQIKLLKRAYNVISPDHFRGWLQGGLELPPRSVLLTCDDGLLNNVSVMLPVLEQEGLQCLFFVTGESLEDPPSMLWYIELYLLIREARLDSRRISWRGMDVPATSGDPVAKRMQWLMLMKRLSTMDRSSRVDFLNAAVEWWGVEPGWKAKYMDGADLKERFQLLGPAQLRQLAGVGMTIGAHTMSHPELSQQPDHMAQLEIMDCRRELGQITGQAIWALAYPYGNPAAVGDREFRLAQEAGYECAFINVSGELATASRFALPRIHVTADMSLSVFEANISGFHENLRAKLRAPANAEDRSDQ